MKNYYEKVCYIFATGFGIGYLLPVGQGTLAALAALFFVPAFLRQGLFFQLAEVAVALLVGVYASSVAEKHFGAKDDHRIVIDEIVSIFITFIGFNLYSGFSLYLLAIGFILNRLLDWWKPFPVNRAQNLSGGWGIMLDDVLSAFCANIILHLLFLL